jgi:NAD(P)H-dependent FMN reductase
MNQPVLQIIVGSTRSGRKGPAVAEWVERAAVEHGGFAVELVDLAQVDLPLLDEPDHPRFGRYTHESTRRWSETVQRADAFVFVVPEYNHSFNAATKNALDHLHAEWAHKPVGTVTYGGVSGGVRAMEALRPVFSGLRMVVVNDAVNIPFFATQIDDDGAFHPSEVSEQAAKAMLDELVRYTEATHPLRHAS